MAFFQLVLKARKVEKARLRYEDEKLRSIEISKGAKPRYTLGQVLRRRKLRCKKSVKEFWDKITTCPEDSWFHKKAVSLRTDGTFENYILKSVFGFFGGMFLTYIFFVFFVFQLNIKLSSAMMFCSIIGVVLTLGLAFSHKVRCVVFLLLPQFFSKRGRQALMAYAFILALTGPAKNTLHNTGVLSESLACGQEQLKEAVKTVIDLAKQPFYALREAISKVIKTVKVVVKKIKQTLIAIKRLVLSILRVITSVFQWLGSIVNMCNKKLGTPFDRCQRVFDGAVADCQAKLGPIFGVICNLTYIVSALCYIVKPLDFICMLVSYVADTVVNVVRAKIKRFAMHMKAMFYVKVKFSHSFHFETNQSKTIEEVSTGIVTEIRSRTEEFLAVFDWMSFLTSFFIFFILLRVMHYRHKWLTSERFDNRYITNDLRTIDLIRARQEKETVLPLNRRESSRYIPLTSITLISVEKVKLAKSAIFLSLATFKLLFYMMVDYSLYWILSTIRFHGRFQSKVERPNVVGIHVSGDGYLAELYKSIVNAFTPHGKEMEIDTMSCLPDPIPPDLDRYTQIASLMIFCWLMAIFEPYGLRLRQVVMCHYHPDRAKQRAAWLYNHIIRSRGNFLKFARRQLRRKFGMAEGEKVEKVTMRERLGAICPFLNKLFPQKQNMCLLCGAVEYSDKNLHIKCPTPGCVGLFCTQCFADLQNMCTICQSPFEYGDLSDMSEEKDSSDDQLQVIKEKMVKSVKKKELQGREVKEEDGKDKDEEQKVEERKTDKDEHIDDEQIKALDSSPESSYSYSYQDESPTEIDVNEQSKPFRDVEAQKIRDDVTTQIFNEPLIKEVSSTSDSPTSSFAVRAHRKIRARLKKKSRSSLPREKDSDSSTSIADTESWPTEEVDEEEVIHTEIDDVAEELLLEDRKDKRKRGRINKIVAAVSGVPWLRKESLKKRTDKRLKIKRPSFMKKIASLIHGKQTTEPIETTDKTVDVYSSSVSSSSSDDENKTLLKTQDSSSSTERLRNKKLQIKTDNELDDYYLRNQRLEKKDVRGENINIAYPYEKKFTTKELPRYLGMVSKGTSYFEVDETESNGDQGVARVCVRQVEDINLLSDIRTPLSSRKADTWNITTTDEFPGSCACALESSHQRNMDKNIHSLRMTTIAERVHGFSETESDTKTEVASTASPTEGATTVSHTEATTPHSQTEIATTVSPTEDANSVSQTGDTSTASQIGNASVVNRIENVSGISQTENTSTVSENDTEYTEDTKSVETESKEQDSNDVPENSEIEDSTEHDTGTSEELTTDLNESLTKREKKSPSEKQVRELKPQEAQETLTRSRVPRLYDPLAGLELYGARPKTKKRLIFMNERKMKEGYNNDSDMADAKGIFTVKDQSAMLKPEAVTTEIKKASNFPDESEYHRTDFQKDSYKKDQETGSTKAKQRLKRKEYYAFGSSKRLEGGTSEILTSIDGDFHTGKDKKKRRDFEHDRQKRGYKADSDISEDEPLPRQKYSNDVDNNDRRLIDTRGQFVSGFRSILHPETSENLGPERERERAASFLRYDQHPAERSHDVHNQTERELNREYTKQSQHRYHTQHEYREPERQHYPHQSYREKNYATDTSRSDLRYCQHPSRDCNRDGDCGNVEFLEKLMSQNIQVPQRRPEAPALKRYLPMYQSPELIEELKSHDKMKLIREREAKKWRASSSSLTDSDISTCFTSRTKEVIPSSTVYNAPVSTSMNLAEEEDTLPYQETQAYKNVVCEFQKSLRQKTDGKPDETVPLICLSRKADHTKEVKKLFPLDEQRYQRKSGVVSRFANRVADAFKDSSNKKRGRNIYERKVEGKKMLKAFKDSVFSNKVSSEYNCPHKTHECCLCTSTSSDGTTDDNESTR